MPKKILIRLGCIPVAALLTVGAVLGQDAGSVLERHSLSDQASQQWKLPDKLNEISGLALTDDGRLLAVADEEAIVFEIDYEDGRLVKAFALGEPTLRGDFEGIASSGGRVWLVTSEGVIFESAEGGDGERVGFDEYRTGLGELCEVEGLAFRAGDRMLLLPCKKVRRKSNLEGLAVFAWSTTARSLEETKTVPLPDREIAAALQTGRLNPSGIAIDPATENLLIVAARQQALVELAVDGAFVAARVLPLAARHRQAEGIEILPSGALLVADEGGGHKARLAVYRPDRRAAERE